MRISNLNITAKELYSEGISYFQSGNLSASKNCFTKVLKIESCHSRALNNLGVIAYSENKVIEAEDFFHRSCKSDPENYEAAANLANLCFTEKKYDIAEKLFLFLKQKEPGNPEYLLKLGDCYVAFAQYDTAYDFYRKAGKLNPKDKRVIKRINLLASALTPLPFSVSRPDRKNKIKIGYGNGLAHIKEFEKYSFIDTFKIAGDMRKEIDFSDPLDFLIIKDNPLIFKDNLPAVCKILILSGNHCKIDLGKSQRLNNLDYVFCKNDTMAEKLISGKTFADYQVKISRIENDTTENTWSYLKDLYIEMVLFYADVLELQDCNEQAYWILQKASAHFPEDLSISERYEKGKKKIKHLFEPGSCINVYVESAEESKPN